MKKCKHTSATVVSQLAFTFRSGARRQVLTWRAIAVLADGRGNGNCGHSHAEQIEAERCPWTPEPWPEVCDLLVRQVRDVAASGDRVRTRRRRAA